MMPTFSNLESLDSVRTKINTAILATEQNTLNIVNLNVDITAKVAEAGVFAAASSTSANASAASATLSSAQATVATTKASEAAVSAVAANTSANSIPKRFTLRSTAVTDIAAGFVPLSGVIYNIEGFDYIGSLGATKISDLHGLLPYGSISPQHFGGKTGAALTAAWTYFNDICGTTPGNARATASAIPFFLPSGRYNSGGANIVLTTGGTGQVVYGEGRTSQLCNVTLNVADNNVDLRDFDFWDGAKAVNAINIIPRGATMRWGALNNVRVRDYAIGLTLDGNNAWFGINTFEVERSTHGLRVIDTVGTRITDSSFRLNDEYGIWVTSGGELRLIGVDTAGNGREGVFGNFANVVVENYWDNVSASGNQTNLAFRDTFAISSAASNGAGGTRLTTVAHSLTEGMQGVIVTGTTNYNGTFDVFNVTSTTFDIAVAFVSTQTGVMTRPEWDVRFVNASGNPANMNDQFFSDCNINKMSLQNCYNFSFVGCRLKEQLWLDGGCYRITRIGMSRGRQTASYKDIDISGQNFGFSELIQTVPNSAGFTSPGGMVMRAPDSTAALVGNKPSKYNSVQVTSNSGVKVTGVTNLQDQVLSGDGTEDLPSYSWLSDPDTGFYKAATGSISTAINGAETWRNVASGMRWGLLTTNISGVPNPQIQIESTGFSGIAFKRSSPDALSPVNYFVKSRGTTVGDYTIVQLNDFLVDIRAHGAEGTTTVQSARISANVEGTPAAGDVRAGWRFYTGSAAGVTTEALRIGTDQSVLAKGTGGLGYGTNAGGAVTQITSRATGVTINNPTGSITLFSAAGSATATSFVVTNSRVSVNDTININQRSGTNDYLIFVTRVTGGTFTVTFYTTGGTAIDAPVFNFTVVKGAVT